MVVHVKNVVSPQTYVFKGPIFNFNFYSNSTNAAEFPVHALPEKIKNAVISAKANIQSPTAMIVASALAAVSLACQKRVRVQRTPQLSGPCSLFFLTIAETGERKSATDKVFIQPIREIEYEQERRLLDAVEKFKAGHQMWVMRKKSLISNVKVLERKGISEGEAHENLRAHLMSEPKMPTQMKWIYNDVSIEALLLGLSEFGGSAAVFVDEGATFFNRLCARPMSILNSVWSGTDIDVNRISSSSFGLRDVSLTLSIQTQSSIFDAFKENKGDSARNIGFFSRFLVAEPMSTQGTRMIQNQLPQVEELLIFHKRIKEIMSEEFNHQGTGPSRPVTLKFSPEAAECWVRAYNEIEAQLGQGGFYQDMRDFGSKLSENIARLAALFHYFEGHYGSISIETLYRAIEVLNWYVNEFKRLFGTSPPIPQIDSDKMALATWLKDHYFQYGATAISKNRVRQYGPSFLRNKARLDAAINALSSENRIALYFGDKFGQRIIGGRFCWIQGTQFL